MGRTVTALEDSWYFVKSAADAQDAFSIAERGKADKITLPHTWNAQDGQDGGNDYYRGTCWYVRQMDPSRLIDQKAGSVFYLEFLGAAYTAEVYVNGSKRARHEDGFSTFRVDITEEMREGSPFTLAVSCDNSSNDHVYPQKADFTFYGGLYRMVNLIQVPQIHFDLSTHGTNGIKVTPVVMLPEEADSGITGGRSAASAQISVEVWLDAADAKELDNRAVHIMIQDQNGMEVAAADAMTDEDGHAATQFNLDPVHLWDGLEDPYLYTARAELAAGAEASVYQSEDPGNANDLEQIDGSIVLSSSGEETQDAVSTRFGCRVFAYDAQKGFFLNGRSYPLRGVSMHQDYKGIGNALTQKEFDEDMAFVQEIGANTLRLAHYQHNQYFYDLCDENGIIVWVEIPFITMFMPAGKDNTLEMMTDLILQNYNHPSIAVWGLSNEITAASPVNEALLENHRELNALAHRLDPTRKTTMADVFMLETDSPILEIPDINSYNLYFGWYVGELDQADEFFDDYHKKYPDRIIGYSEYGADANPQYQAEHPERSDYTEGYQALYHEHQLQMINARPYLWATHVWNLFDFAADGRDEGGKHGENQKGLVTFDRKIRKDAFYLYKAAWNKTEPFVHICGRRYVKRECEKTQIKVYSNLPEVELYVDGKKAGSQKGKTIFTFEIANIGTQLIEVRAKRPEEGWKAALRKGAEAFMEAAAEDGRVTQNSIEIDVASGEERTDSGIADTEAAFGNDGYVSDTIRITKVDTAEPSYIYNKPSDGVANWFDASEIDQSCWSVEDKLGELQVNPKTAPIVNEIMAKATASRGEVASSVKDNPVLKQMLARMTLASLLKQAGADTEQVKQLNRVLQAIKK